MRHPELIVASRMEAMELLAAPELRREIRHIVSIGAPGDAPQPGYAQCSSRPRLEFHDVVAKTELACALQPAQVRAVIGFACKIQRTPGRLLIHCEAGISRSTAAALTALALWLGPGGEAEAVARLYAIRAQALPNRLFVRIADQLLARAGALMRALEVVAHYD